MQSSSGHWVVVGQSATAAEQAALDAVRELLPDDGITHAWANLTFVSRDGRTSEVDVLLLTKSGLFVVELKGWHGTVTCELNTWTQDTGRTIRPFRNSYLIADDKAKKLASILKDVSERTPGRPKIPLIKSIVVMHGDGSTVVAEASKKQEYGLWALDGYEVKGLTGTRDFSTFLAAPAADHRNAIDLQRSRQIIKLANEAGFKPTLKSKMVGQYVLDTADVLDTTPTYQDLLADLPVVNEKRRIRLFDVPLGASADVRAEIENAARREYQLARGIGPNGQGHAGIDAPLDYIASDYGPALVFGYDPTEVPLDEYLRDHSHELSLLDRLRLIRQIAEIIKYAHARSIVHRALLPRAVYVSLRDDVRTVRIRDWMLGRKAATGTTSLTLISGGVTTVDDGVAAENWPYLASETVRRATDPPPMPLDVFGLGALAYLVLTGQAPARAGDLEQIYASQPGFNPQAVMPELSDFVALVVEEATRFAEAERTPTVDQFLQNLEVAESELIEGSAPPAEAATRDPLEASKGETIGSGRFIVRGRRGTGSTGTAILVDDTHSEGSKSVVLKLARDDAAAVRLLVEVEALEELDHPRVVRMLEGPIEVDGRTAILMTDAGRQTLADRLHSEGQATLEQLENYSADILEAVAYLDDAGIFHRDIKPANIAIGADPGTRKPRATLFDFSLAREPLHKIESGSQPYLDPFLGRGSRRQYDRAAELYAVAVTLFELASGEKPWWRDGDSVPTGLDDRAVILPSQFLPAVANGLVNFFERALAPDVSDRFGNLDEFRRAWSSVFESVTATGDDEDTEDARDGLAAAATLDTPIDRSGLSAHAQSGLTRIGVATVGDLIARSPVQINAIAGLGERTRKEITRRRRAWLERLGGSSSTQTEAVVLTDESVERRVRRLIPTATGDTTPEHEVLGALLHASEHPVLESPWPSLAEVSTATGRTLDEVRQIVDTAVKRWRKSGVVAPVVDEVAAALETRGGVATVGELASALLLRYGSGFEGERRQAIALGLLRAVVELDATAQVPALAASRSTQGGSVLVALSVDTARMTAFSPELLISATRAAAADVDDALDEKSVWSPAAMRARLRVSVPEAAFDDRRLLELATRSSVIGELSTQDEVYRRDIAVTDAAEATLRGWITNDLLPDAITKQLKRRFPAVTASPTKPDLDGVLAITHPHLHWSGERYTTSESGTSATQSTQIGTQFSVTPALELSAAFERSLERNSALTIAVHPKRYTDAARVLQQRFGVEVVDVSLEVAARIREAATAKGARWEVVSEADADPAGPTFGRLESLAKEAIAPWWQSLMARATPLLLIHAAPLARYDLSSLLAELTDLSVKRPAARWLLVPQNPSSSAPDLDSGPVPVGPDRWVTLPTSLTDLVLTGDAA